MKAGLVNVTGFHADIDARAILLPCEPTAVFYAHSAAWAGATVLSPVLAWAQMGYIRRRFAGTTVPIFRTYTEVSSPAAYHIAYFAPPAIGTRHIYQGTLDPTTGTWAFSYDNLGVIHQFTNFDWRLLRPARADYSAEIYDLKSQMVGTAAVPCRFTNCQYRLAAGLFVAAGFVAADMFVSPAVPPDLGWSNSLINATTIDVWDNQP